MALRTILLTLSLILFCLAAGFWAIVSSGATQSEAIERTIAKLEQAPAEQTLPLLRQLAAARSDSTPLLAQCLCSVNENVVDAANLVLSERLASWRNLPRSMAAERLLTLVSEIETRLPELSPPGMTVARRVVRETLTWPALPGSQQTPALLVACEKVIAVLDRNETLLEEADATAPLRIAERSESPTIDDSLQSPLLVPSPAAANRQTLPPPAN